MKSKTILTGTLLGGVFFFILGWLIFGILLEPVTRENYSSCINLPMEEMRFGPLILSNLIWGLLLSLSLNWNQHKGLMGGLKTGALIGLIVSSGTNLSFYSMTTFFTSISGLIIDVVANTILYALVGALLGAIVFKPVK